MSTALSSKSFKSRPQIETSDALRDLVATMPIVILANAIRAALQIPASKRSAAAD